MTTIWEIDEDDHEIEGLDDNGRPDPAYAASLGLTRAPMLRRAAAFAVDIVAFWIVQLPLLLFAMPLIVLYLTGGVSLYGLIYHPRFVLAAIMAGVSVVLLIALGIAQLVAHGRRGTSIGKAFFGVRSVNIATLERPGFWRIVLRLIVFVASGIVVVGPLLMVLSSFWDPAGRRRGWHDYAGGVWLVDIKRGLNPYDEKRMRIARKAVRVETAPEREARISLATPSGESERGEYRPVARVSSGVLGMARATTDPRRDGPAPEQASVVLGVPGGLRGAPPAQPAPQPPAPAAPAPAAAPPQAPAPVPAVAYELEIDSGQRVRVGGLIVLGRAPRAEDVPQGVSRVAIPDDTRSISKTHLSARPLADGVEIIDLDSTNGCEIERAGQTRAIPPRTPIRAIPGDVVRFGDRSLVIIAAPTD
ncbi:MAG: RDD family protein [Microbacterium gubbeenense]|uniref:RDD family protein n=1 Tax=Microbacterium gubbeenense TaxID=159896 RepID=UPI003F9D85A6